MDRLNKALILLSRVIVLVRDVLLLIVHCMFNHFFLFNPTLQLDNSNIIG